MLAFCIWILHIPLTNTLYKSSLEIEMNNAIPGTTVVLFYFYYVLTKITNAFTWKDMFFVSCIMVYYIVNQNRSLMFPCLFFYMYVLLYKSKPSMSLRLSVLACLFLVLFYNFDLIESVIDETRNQADDDNYVRWRAIDYFITKFSPNIICTIFGNGIISSISNPGLWQILYSKMWNFNDVGWFGYYAFFGITGILAIFNIIMRILFDRNSFLGIKMLLIHMLIPTIWCFWDA